MTNKFIQDIIDFHAKFGLPAPHWPTPLTQELWAFRAKFLLEEATEFATATDTADALDALVDIIYVALGTAHFMGLLPIFEQAWDNVHAANMAKTRAKKSTDSKRGTSLDIIKPPGWTAPDHHKLLETYVERLVKDYQESTERKK